MLASRLHLHLQVRLVHLLSAQFPDGSRGSPSQFAETLASDGNTGGGPCLVMKGMGQIHTKVMVQKDSREAKGVTISASRFSLGVCAAKS